MKKNFRVRNKLLKTNLRKVIKYQEHKYTLEDLLRLLKDQGSLIKVSETTHIPYPRLYSIFRKHFGKGIDKIKELTGFVKGKDRGYTYSLKKIVRLFKKYGFLPDVSKVSGIPINNLRHILTKEFDMGLFELRKKLGIRKSCLKWRDLEKNSSRYQQVKEAYERLGTLAKAGEELHLTRERVRQILNQGEKRGIFIYELNREKRFREILQKYDRESLIKEIKILVSPSKICIKLGIRQSDFKKLLDYFNIEYKEYRLLAVMGKTLEKYSQIVDMLGHHPSTTEMNSRRDWRTVWGAIDRYWDNMNNFRKEFGIEIPKFRIHPNTVAFWKQALEKRKQIKKEKKDKLLNLIKELQPISSGSIQKSLDIRGGTLAIYLKQLLQENLISRIGTGNRVKYVVNEYGVK